MAIKKISVIGLGTLGTQIAIQAAYYGYAVRGYDQAPQIFQETIPKIKAVMKLLGKGPTMGAEEWEKGAVQIKVTKDLAIDRAWMVMYTQTFGPFFLMDFVGLDVVYNIEMFYYNESKDPKDYPPKALKDMIDRKELGVKTGKGFYMCPHPEFDRSEFLKG